MSDSFLGRGAPFYQSLFHKDFLKLKIQETKATCDKCIMSCERKSKGLTYEENLKCCTFHPFLPNFLVGGIFSDPTISKEKKDVLRQKIKNKEGVLPVGITATVDYFESFSKREKHEFGNREDWLCPYYDKAQNQCGIWKYRGVVCTTFFCESNYGKKGKDFWKTTSDYLSYTEMALLEEALVHLDFSPRQLSEQLEYIQEPKVIPAKLYKKLWNHYDDPEKFYIKCYEFVREIKKDYFVEAMGEMGEKLQDKVIAQGKKIAQSKGNLKESK